MISKHDNLIGGEWKAGEAMPRIAIRPIPRDVIGEYAKATQRRSTPRWQPRAPPSRPGRRAASRRAPMRWTRSAPRSSRAGRTRHAAGARGRQDPAEGIGEATRAGKIFKFFAGECLRLSGETLPSVRPGIGVEITREPVGVVGLITPWNFPIAIPAWKIAPALAFGNCVVFKPADLVPGCAWALAEIISRSGMPPGVFNLVMGRGSVIGDALVNHPGVHAISFTGSVGVGRRIASPVRDEPQEGAARDGRQEPAGGARRRRPETRRSS